MSAFALNVRAEHWPIDGAFTISRGSKSEAVTVIVELTDGAHIGRGECVPYARYGETAESVIAAIQVLRIKMGPGLSRDDLQKLMPPGAARNAVDCALWDIECKRTGLRAYQLARLAPPQPLPVTYTLSLDTADAMAKAAQKKADQPILKIKLGADGDGTRLQAIRQAVPKARLIVDANEGWTPDNLAANLASCLQFGVELIEQPLPAGKDEALSALRLSRAVPVCADESVFDRASLPALKGKYDVVNIKLDKTGGLTEALAMIAQARDMGFGVMVGCMVSTSLAIAPAILAAQQALFADLDGPMLLARDRDHGLRYRNGCVEPPTAALWG